MRGTGSRPIFAAISLSSTSWAARWPCTCATSCSVALASLADHRRAFAAAMATLLAEFNTYLDQGHADPTADSVGYVQVPLWLSQDELAGLIDEVRDALLARRDNEPAPGRSPYLVSPILFPLGEQGRRVSRIARAEPSA